MGQRGGASSKMNNGPESQEVTQRQLDVSEEDVCGERLKHH